MSLRTIARRPAGASAPKRCGTGDREAGAYLVLYALLGVAFFAMAALVLDIASLRYGRRADRAAADLAVTAGVIELQVTDPSSFSGACEAAWGYLLANRTEAEGTITPPDCTTTFPAADACTGTSGARTAAGAIGPLAIEITHPVPDGSALMLADAQGGDVAQSINPPSDGSACERMAVRIVRERTFLFGQIAGVVGGRTDVHSVARPLTTTSLTEVPSVIVLEPTSCNALTTAPAGGVLRLGGAGTPGVAIVDSAGSGCGAAFAIDAGSGGIFADPAGATAGQIRSFAMSQSTFASAYDPADTGAGRLTPIPTPAPIRTGRALIDGRYHCPSCGPGGDPIGQLEAARNVVGAPAATTSVVNTCAVAPGPPAVFLSPHIYVDCDDFVVDGSATFLAQSVTFKGNLVVNDNACAAVNDPTCGAVVGVATQDADVFVRGNVSKAVKGKFALPRTFVYANGAVNIGVDPDTGIGNSSLSWTAPLDGGFEDLLFWSESAAPMVLGEQRTIPALVGTFFAPNARLSLNPRNGGVGVTSAMQVVARTVTVSGNGTFRLQPGPGRATGSLTRQVRLIR